MSHIKLTQLRPGSTVLIRADIGVGSSVEATVTHVTSSIKNGLPGIHYTTKTGQVQWAFLSQVERVVKF